MFVNPSNFISDVGSLSTSTKTSYNSETHIMTGTAALSPKDIIAICDYLDLPSPTPLVTFDDVIAMSGMNRDQVYARLSHSTSLDVMIAAAALRSGVTRLADDRRLKPEPHAKSPRTTSSPAPRKARTENTEFDVNAVINFVGECPSKAGSERAIRFSNYAVGKTLGQCLEGGLRAKDIRRHLADGVVAVTEA